MRYYNQLRYAALPYPTALDDPQNTRAHAGTVATSGCGLCCACMVVDRLCLTELTLEECLRLAHAAKADREPGTDMQRLGPAVAEKFGLQLYATDDAAQLVQCLRTGGVAVINVGGDRPGHKGIFSSCGHYILALSVGADGDTFCVLDPSWREDKYAAAPRRDAVRQDGYWLYTDTAALLADTANRSPAFYLFSRGGTD